LLVAADGDFVALGEVVFDHLLLLLVVLNLVSVRLRMLLKTAIG
jgi:hypothetical protein